MMPELAANMAHDCFGIGEWCSSDCKSVVLPIIPMAKREQDNDPL